METIGCEWRYALLMVQARNVGDDDVTDSVLIYTVHQTMVIEAK